ncbi:hypothetical protein [Gulosibacter molinativorax]|uniref:hypothetical protein n=1 Tax=Gulosibacter molinativorax TaxID=256821 RepID=UPI0015E6CFE7|nr:hypothetical protein [Gulosibacter molinativorax]QUY61894.1 Hypotetical protein [Gulosibacter molinativorax]
MPAGDIRAFIDESSGPRPDGQQEYLVCAALVEVTAVDAVRQSLRTLLLPGQLKLHWSDEQSSRRRKIVSQVADLDVNAIVVSHLDEQRKQDERYRRKCLETLYYTLVERQIFGATLESRSSNQDKLDRAHIVSLQGQGQGLDPRLRINHARGRDEQLLWISDAVLGTVHVQYLDDGEYMAAFNETLRIRLNTPSSRGE